MKIAAFLLLFGVLGSCQSQQPASPNASLQGLSADRRDEARALVAQVEGWLVRTSTQTPSGEREKTTRLADGLRARLEHLRPALASPQSGATVKIELERELSELGEAYGQAVASISTERRRAEGELTEATHEMSDDLRAFRLDVSSRSAQGNAEIKRRLAQLDAGQKEMAATLSDLRRMDVARWSALYRRWRNQRRAWDADLRQARDRLKMILIPAEKTKLE